MSCLLDVTCLHGPQQIPLSSFLEVGALASLLDSTNTIHTINLYHTPAYSVIAIFGLCLEIVRGQLDGLYTEHLWYHMES